MNPFFVRYFIAFGVAVLFMSCGNNDQQNTASSEVQEIIIDTLYNFADFDSHDLASPTDIIILQNELMAIPDYDTQVITLMTPEGDIISTFGRQGRGPGEFLNIRHLYDLGYGLAVFDSHLNRLSYFDFEGDLLATHDLPSHALNKDFTLINDSLYVINREGINGSLFQLQSLNSEYVFEFGEPYTLWEQRGNLSDAHNQLTSGKVPEMFKNKAKLHSDGTHLYIFFEALSEMQKYDLEGNLIWHHKIDLPHNEEIFEGTIESAKQYGSSNSVPVLDYATEFQKIGEEIYILTRRDKTKNVKQLLVHVNETGTIETMYHFPQTHEMCFDFDIDAQKNMLYLTSCLSGNVKRTQLPL